MDGERHAPCCKNWRRFFDAAAHSRIGATAGRRDSHRGNSRQGRACRTGLRRDSLLTELRSFIIRTRKRNSYDGSFVELRTAFAGKYLASPNFPVLRQALQPAPCGRGFGAIAMALQEFTQSLRRFVIPPYGGERLRNKKLDLGRFSVGLGQR